MRKLTSLLMLVMLTALSVQAYNWNTRGNRATTLVSGKYYVIYNTCATSGYGKFFLYDNGSSLGVTSAATPAVFTTPEAKHIWQVIATNESNIYYLKNFATGKYVNVAGVPGNATEQRISIMNGAVYFGARGGNVMNEDGSDFGDAKNYKQEDLFFISGEISNAEGTVTGNTNNNWTSNNGAYANANWGAQAHAFYEVTEDELNALYSWERVGNRATSLEFGGYYVIYNTCSNGSYGKFFLYDNGTRLDEELADKPADFATPELKHVWKLTSVGNNIYNLRNLATGKYVNVNGSTNNSEAQNLRITSAKDYATNKRGGGLMNEDGTAYGDGSDASHSAYTGEDVFYITNATDGNYTTNWTSDYGRTFVSNGNGAQAHAFYKLTNEQVLSFFRPISSVAELKAEATAALEKTGPGYPKEDSAERTALATALEGDMNNHEDAIALYDALHAYYESVDIALPEDGKAYKIIAKYHNGDLQPLWWNGTKITNTATTAAGYTEPAATFICRCIEGDKIAFVNNSGKYLSWFSDGKGFKKDCGGTDSYNTDANAYNDLVITRATVDKVGGSVDASATNESLYGYVHIQGKNTDGKLWYLAARGDGDFIAGGNTDKWYDYDGVWSHSYRSVAFKIEEVDDFGNKINFTQLNGTNHYVATYSAPFATVIPEGVKAYAITAQSSTVATTTVLDGGTAIPANTGVLLDAEGTDAKYMTPATTEEAATCEGTNLLAGTGATSQAVDGSYILAKKDGVVGFYKANGGTLKAYRAYIPVAAGVRNIVLFDDIETGIDNIDGTAESNNAAIYDLSGRRVNNARKGIYIINGKKMIK